MSAGTSYGATLPSRSVLRSRPVAAAPSEIRLAPDLDVLDRCEIERLQEQNMLVAVTAAGSADIGGKRQGTGLIYNCRDSSGRQNTVHHSWEFNDQAAVLGARGVRSVTQANPAKVVNCVSLTELRAAFLFAQELTRKLPALSFPVGAALGHREVTELIERHEIDTLVASSHYGVDLLTGSLAGRLGTLRNFLHVGDELPAAAREAVTAGRRGLNVHSLGYSSVETGPIGYQCGYLDATTYHLHEDAVIVKVVDEYTDEPLDDGTAGEIVVRPLTDCGMSLPRYRIGDRGRLEPATRCRCGSLARRLVLCGRIGRSILIDTHVVTAELLLTLLGPLGVTDLAGCQLQVSWQGESFGLRLLLASPRHRDLDKDEADLALLGSHTFQAILGSRRCRSWAIECVDVARFAMTQGEHRPLFHQLVH